MDKKSFCLFRSHAGSVLYVSEVNSFIPKFRFLGETNTSNASVLLRKLCGQDPCDRDGNTLLHFCCFYEMRDVSSSFPVLEALKLLLEAGCNVNAVNDSGDTPLHLAVTLIL